MLPALAMRRRRREVEDREGRAAAGRAGRRGGAGGGGKGEAAWNQMTSAGDGGYHTWVGEKKERENT